MDLFWMGVILVALLTYVGASIVFIILWRRAGIQKIEGALSQLQNELARINSLLDETRSRVVHAASGGEGKPAAGEAPDAKSPDAEG